MMKRIILHWTAGAARPSDLDRQHYHFIVAQAGNVVAGVFPPEANNLAPLQEGRYAAHTRGCNTGSIGVALAGMMAAVECPFIPGPAPITAPQVDRLLAFVAGLCREYSIPVARQTVLSHAEVQPTLGKPQRGKWDIAWLPGMAAPADPVTVGDTLRARIKASL